MQNKCKEYIFRIHSLEKLLFAYWYYWHLYILFLHVVPLVCRISFDNEYIFCNCFLILSTWHLNNPFFLHDSFQLKFTKGCGYLSHISWQRYVRKKTSLRTPALLGHPFTVTLLSMRGRDARRFFDSTPGVSQPGDGFQVACCSLSSAVSRRSRARARAANACLACVSTCSDLSKPTDADSKMRKARDARDRQVTRSRWSVKEFTPFPLTNTLIEVCVAFLDARWITSEVAGEWIERSFFFSVIEIDRARSEGGIQWNYCSDEIGKRVRSINRLIIDREHWVSSSSLFDWKEKPFKEAPRGLFIIVLLCQTMKVRSLWRRDRILMTSVFPIDHPARKASSELVHGTSKSSEFSRKRTEELRYLRWFDRSRPSTRPQRRVACHPEGGTLQTRSRLSELPRLERIHEESSTESRPIARRRAPGASAMEDELRCPSCKELFVEPVLLPCWHALCLACAVNLQAPPDSPPESTADSSNAPGSDQEADKLSILSETDSGVVCSSTSTSSRPGSYVGTPGNGGGFPPSGGTLCLSCPVCQKTVYFDEGGAHNLPKYWAMQHIVDKYQESRNARLQCQMCEGEPRDATVACEQCEVSPIILNGGVFTGGV